MFTLKLMFWSIIFACLLGIFVKVKDKAEDLMTEWVGIVVFLLGILLFFGLGYDFGVIEIYLNSGPSEFMTPLLTYSATFIFVYLIFSWVVFIIAERME